MPLALAFSSPPAPARLDTTTAISAGKSFCRAASISAAMFDPRPEIKMATRRFIASPRKVEVTIIDHAVLARGRDHFAEQRDTLAALAQDLVDLLYRIRFHDRDNADAAIEGAQQLEFGDAALLRQPFEHRQHRQTRQIDADAQMFWQHARNVVGKTA